MIGGNVQPNDPLIGQRLANFQIKHLIERGGMAAVYYGWDAKLLRPAAIKVIDTQFQDVAYAKRLVQEAQIIAQWRHENVIQVYYADQRDRLYYFAMEYIDGLDLGSLMAQYAQSGKLIPHADVLRIGRSISDALDFAHQRGVIHRDVKPSNVMLASDGRVVLTDFGLALDVHKGTYGEVLGTPHYIAPEQAHDSMSAVPQSDLYSLGVVLYELLTGSVPFDDPSPMSLAMKHMTDSPPLPTQINPTLSVPVEAVLLRALSKTPAERYQTGQALLDALQSAFLNSTIDDPSGRMNTAVSSVLASHVLSRTEIGIAGPTSRPEHDTQSDLARTTQSRWLWMLIGLLSIMSLVGAGVFALIAFVANPSSPAAPDVTQPVQPSEVSLATNPPEAVPATEQSQPQLSPSPEPTLAGQPATSSPPAGSYRVTLFYTDRGFYLWNTGTLHLQVAHLAFEALDASGVPTSFRFEGNSWTEFFPSIEPGLCDVIEIAGTSAFTSRPDECSSFNAQRTPGGGSPEIFWTAREGITQFRVLWDAQEVGRCEIAARQCAIFLPLP